MSGASLPRIIGRGGAGCGARRDNRETSRTMVWLPYSPDFRLPILGLLVTFAGACWAAQAVIIDEKTARELATPKWDMNEDLRQALLKQSRAARNGLILVGIGSAIQIFDMLLQAASFD